jgi:hypothetical protein
MPRHSERGDFRAAIAGANISPAIHTQPLANYKGILITSNPQESFPKRQAAGCLKVRIGLGALPNTESG